MTSPWSEKCVPQTQRSRLSAQVPPGPFPVLLGPSTLGSLPPLSHSSHSICQQTVHQTSKQPECDLTPSASTATLWSSPPLSPPACFCCGHLSPGLPARSCSHPMSVFNTVPKGASNISQAFLVLFPGKLLPPNSHQIVELWSLEHGPNGPGNVC